MDLSESVVVITVYLRQNATEDFIGAVFEVSEATISRRRALLGPGDRSAGESEAVSAEVTRGDTVLVDEALIGPYQGGCARAARFPVREWGG